jgi:hypothetical protein
MVGVLDLHCKLAVARPSDVHYHLHGIHVYAVRQIGQDAMATVAALASVAIWNPQVTETIASSSIRIPLSPPACFQPNT